MRLQNLVLTTNVAGIKILTCTNDDIMDNMKLYLRQGVSQYTVTGVKTGNMYKFTFPVLDFGIVRMQFVSTRGTQVRASTIFSTMIEENVVSEPGIEYAKATDLTAVDDKYKIITDNLTGSLNLHKTNYNTFHDDQIIFNNNTTTDISNYKLTTNTSITNINTTLNGMYTKTEVNTLISNTNSSVDTKLQSYYNKTEVDNKLATLDLTNYAPKSTVYTKSETNALFTPYYTKTNVDDKFVLYYTKSNVDSLFANDRLSNDGRYVLKDDYDTYTSTIYTKTEIDNKVSNINTQITGLTNNINTLNTTVGDNYTTLDDKYVALNTKVENYNSTQTTNLNAYKTLTNGNISTLDTNVTNITTNLNDNYYNKTQIDTKLGSVNKIETTVGTTADTNYDADYASKFNLRSQDDGSLLLNIGATAIKSVTDPNSISNIQLKTDVFGKTWVRYYSTQSGVQKFSTWDRLASETDFIVDENSTHKQGIRYYPNKVVEMWFHITRGNTNVLWKTEEELAADAEAIANGTATEYNRHPHKTIVDRWGGYIPLLHVNLGFISGFTVEKIYDIDGISEGGGGYYSTPIILPFEEDVLTPDGKLIIACGGWMPDKPTDTAASNYAILLNEFNSQEALFWEKLKYKKLRILAKLT